MQSKRAKRLGALSSADVDWVSLYPNDSPEGIFSIFFGRGFLRTFFTELTVRKVLFIISFGERNYADDLELFVKVTNNNFSSLKKISISRVNFQIFKKIGRYRTPSPVFYNCVGRHRRNFREHRRTC